MEDLRRIFLSLGSRKEILNSPRVLISLISIRNKQMKSWLTLCPPSLNKTRHTKDATSVGPKQYLLLHATTHTPAIKALQTTKITKLGFLSLSPTRWFLRDSSQYQNWKAMILLAFPRNGSLSTENKLSISIHRNPVLTIRPLAFVKSDYRKTLCTCYQIPGVQTCWHLTFL